MSFKAFKTFKTSRATTLSPVSVNAKRVAVVGAGWAGLAAAISAREQGAQVILLEGTRQAGGRARSIQSVDASGETQTLDNGQHILIGAYHECLRLMQMVGVNPQDVFLNLPLQMPFVDGSGIRCPDWSLWLEPLDALVGIFRTRGWSFWDRCSLLYAVSSWKQNGFMCLPQTTVKALCQSLSVRVQQELIEPLCVSALNTLPDEASGQIFLHVIQATLDNPKKGASRLLLPRVDLGSIWPDSAVRWLQANGSQVRFGQRVQGLQALETGGWQLMFASGMIDAQAPEHFDQVILACPPWEALRLLQPLAPSLNAHEEHTNQQYVLHPNEQSAIQKWCALAQQLRFESIATVYTSSPNWRLPRPMLALRSNSQAPAQFVFDRGQLGGRAGEWAWVVSVCGVANRETLEAQVMEQAKATLRELTQCMKTTGWGLTGFTLDALSELKPQLTIIEKRATFVAHTHLERPPRTITSTLQACGDYVDGLFPATLEAAVLSGTLAGREIGFVKG